LPFLAQSFVLRVAFEAVRERHGRSLKNDQGGEQVDPRRLEAEVAVLKVLGSRHGVDATQACREACGGQGYLSVNRLADLRKDVEVFTTFEGDNVVLSQLVAKALLSDYQGQFADEGAFGVARMLGRRAIDRAVERNLTRVRLRDPAHLRSREFQRATLRYREEHVVETLAARLRKRLASGMDFDLAFLEVQEHALAAAVAFGERLAFDSFVAAERKWSPQEHEPAPGSAAQLLALLGDAYALGVVEKHAAWFLEDGYVEASKSRAIRVEHGRVLGQLAPHARTIVDGFGIPDACLAAPIAFFDPAYPEYRC
jgi:acyl-CoA oxidase